MRPALLALALALLLPAAAQADGPRGFTVHEVQMPDLGGRGLRPSGLLGQGAETRPSSTRRAFGPGWLDVKVSAEALTIRAGVLSKEHLELALPRTEDDSHHPPGHAIGPARACGDRTYVAVEVDMLEPLLGDKHRYQTSLLIWSLPRSGKGKARMVTKLTGGSSWGSADHGWVVGTEVVIDDDCELWAVEAAKTWGGAEWTREAASAWEPHGGSPQLCANEGSPERTIFQRLSLRDAADRSEPGDAPEGAVPLLMVSGSDYHPARDPLPGRALRARCSWFPAAPRVTAPLGPTAGGARGDGE